MRSCLKNLSEARVARLAVIAVVTSEVGNGVVEIVVAGDPRTKNLMRTTKRTMAVDDVDDVNQLKNVLVDKPNRHAFAVPVFLRWLFKCAVDCRVLILSWLTNTHRTEGNRNFYFAFSSL